MEQYAIGLQSKLMGQVNLVRSGVKYLREGGSFTLTSGPTNEDPIPLGTSSAMVNGAVEGFVRSAAIELRRDRRINLVSPTMLEESSPSTAPTSWVRRPWRRTPLCLVMSRASRPGEPAACTGSDGREIADWRPRSK
ncbi:SDR family oxidoreductase [Mesorhizobium captivum]|uniref:SDR family oxidoreductase n=1 Tax=Mesorhizobium captivum TaxID=3072319 RepID=UPI003D310F9E